MSGFNSDFQPGTNSDFNSNFDRFSGVQDPGPVSDYLIRYKLDGSDRISAINGAPYSAGVVPTDCKAAILNGIDQYFLDYNNGNKLKAIGTGPFTMSAWIRNTQTVTQEIWSLGSGGSLNDFSFRLRGTGAFGFRVNATTKGSTALVNTGLLTHITLTSTGSGGVAEWFIGGSLDKSVSMALYDFIDVGVIGIGAEPNGTDRFTDFIDDIRIYNRVLSPAEIASLAAYQCGTEWNDPEAWDDGETWID